MSRSRTIYGPGIVKGEIKVPGDKSISHRAAILASLAEGTSRIRGFSTAADCSATLSCVRKLGIEVESQGDSILIHGAGLNGYKPAGDPVHLDAGNSGSTIRMMSGVLAAQRFSSILDGDSSLRRRPMRRVIVPLELMGARIRARDADFPPVEIDGRQLKPIDYVSPVSSAQVKSCVLLAGLFARGTTRVTEPAQSRNHSELMLPVFGAQLTADGESVAVTGPAVLSPVRYTVPGDASSAAFFCAAAAMIPGSELLIRRVNLNPTRTEFFRVLQQLGAAIERERQAEEHGEIIGDLRIGYRQLRTERAGISIRGPMIPALIDELPMLAVVATQAEGRVEIRDARELRIKESDRIRSIAAGIRALGGEVEEFEDGLAVSGPQKLTGGRVSADGDHRIAMALSIAALAADGATEIVDADCADVSFPEFYQLLESVLDKGSLS
jgi:3-phosphoshikimate 1-carboxyvinyltransferase